MQTEAASPRPASPSVDCAPSRGMRHELSRSALRSDPSALDQGEAYGVSMPRFVLSVDTISCLQQVIILSITEAHKMDQMSGALRGSMRQREACTRQAEAASACLASSVFPALCDARTEPLAVGPSK